MPAPADPRVRVSRSGSLGWLRLERPEALNAIDLGMIRALRGALEAWLDDASLEQVLLEGAGERAFCVGGDIRAVYDGAREDPGSVHTLWREEYELDALLARYPKPVVVLADGLTMGGGLGLAGHVAHRVVTERSRLAMPETAIGLAPDVGGLHLLARAPGELGTHLALTSSQVGGADAVALGLADVVIGSQRLDEVRRRLIDEGADEVLADLAAEPTGPAALLEDREWIDECYAGESPVEILARLHRCPDPAARDAAVRLSEVSPTAVAVALRGLRSARAADDLDTCLVADLRRSVRFLERPDLVEGIRARIIDKDRDPRWTPAAASDVDPSDVEAFFAPLPDDLDLTRLPI